jgi:hypothetical protein
VTPSTLELYCRQRYNAINDAMFSEAEMLTYIWDAQMQLAKETWCIRDVYTTTTVASQQEYAFPTQTLAIKRLTVNGDEAEPRSLEEVLDLTSSTATPTGLTYIYAIWNEVTTSSTLEVPTRYQMDLADYVNEQMCIKDKNYVGAQVYAGKWAEKVMKAKAQERKILRGQQFSWVRDSDRDLDVWGGLR